MSRRTRKTRPRRQPRRRTWQTLLNKWTLAGVGLVVIGVVGFLIAADQPSTTTGAPNVPNQSNIPFPEVSRTPLEEAKAKYDEGTALIVDTRSLEEYNREHIPGAVSLPLSALSTQNPDLPRDQEIITYCT